MMKWSIITNSTETSGGVDISLTPKDDVTRFTILQYKIREVPELIKEVSKSMFTGIEYAHIRNFKDMDWEDKAWAKNVTQYMGHRYAKVFR